MTVTTPTSVKNARLDAISTAWGATPKLRLYSGAPPADVNAALAGNTLLAEVTPTPAGAANGVKDMLGGAKATTGAAAAATGTAATFYRVYNSAGTVAMEQGTVGTAGADLNIDNTSIANGQAVNFNNWTKTEP
jgi:hypothetical protein